MGAELRARAAELGLTIGAPRRWHLLAPVAPAALQAQLWSEGYLDGPPVVPVPLVDRCRAAIELVTDAGAPPLAAFAFDAPWELQALLADHAEAALDGAAQLLPAFFAWRLDATSPRGWPPHRDRPERPVDDRGAPRSISLWVALTDATPDNGCIYVLPAGWDLQYRNPEATAFLADSQLQCVRALPAAAGAVLGWTSALLHWGGMVRPGVAGRISVAFEYQAAGCGAVDERTFPVRDWIPAPAERAGLIALQARQYAQMAERPDGWAARLAAVVDELCG